MTEEKVGIKINVNLNFDMNEWNETRQSELFDTVRHAIKIFNVLSETESETTKKEPDFKLRVGGVEYTKPENTSHFEPRVIGRHAASVDANRRISTAIEQIREFKQKNKVVFECSLAPFTLRVGQFLSDLHNTLLGIIEKCQTTEENQQNPLDKRGD